MILSFNKENESAIEMVSETLCSRFIGVNINQSAKTKLSPPILGSNNTNVQSQNVM